jgi:hypothetical protein
MANIDLKKNTKVQSISIENDDSYEEISKEEEMFL